MFLSRLVSDAYASLFLFKHSLHCLFIMLERSKSFPKTAYKIRSNSLFRRREQSSLEEQRPNRPSHKYLL